MKKPTPVSIVRPANGSRFNGENQVELKVAAGIGLQTLYDRQEQYPELSEQLDQAREQARLKSLFFFEWRKIFGVAFGFHLVGRNEAQARRIYGVALSGRRSRIFEKMAEV